MIVLFPFSIYSLKLKLNFLCTPQQSETQWVGEKTKMVNLSKENRKFLSNPIKYLCSIKFAFLWGNAYRSQHLQFSFICWENSIWMKEIERVILNKLFDSAHNGRRKASSTASALITRKTFPRPISSFSCCALFRFKSFSSRLTRDIGKLDIWSREWNLRQTFNAK